MICSISSLNKPALLVHFGSVLCFTLVQQGDQTSSLGWGAWLHSGSPSRCSPGSGAAWTLSSFAFRWLSISLPLPLLLCSNITKKIWGFKRFFITWECFQRTQNISSCIWCFPFWQSNKINVTFLLNSVWVPIFFQSHLTLDDQGAR